MTKEQEEKFNTWLLNSVDEFTDAYSQTEAHEYSRFYEGKVEAFLQVLAFLEQMKKEEQK